MKKALKRAAVVLLIVVLILGAAAGGLFGYAAWRRGSVPQEVSQWDMALDSGRDVMRVRLENFSAADVTGMQVISTENRSGADLEEIVLRAFANGAESLGTGTRGVDVTNVYVNDEAVSFAFDQEDPTVVRVAYPWKAGEEITLRWHISAPLSGDQTLISLPVLGVVQDGAWRTDAWDPLVQSGFAQAFDWEIWMEYNHDIDVAFGGAVLGYGDDPSGRISQARMLGARDVTLLVTRGRTLRSREAAGVKLAAVAEGYSAAEALLDQAEKALESLAQAGFAYPFPALTIVQMETGYEDGYACSGLIALGKEENAEAQLRRMTRLIARQTFGVLVGSDPWQEPWLSFTLASTAELMAYRHRKGQLAFEARFFDEIEVASRLTRPYGVTVGAGIERFGGDTEMTQVLRDQGAAMMLGIEEAMGREAFLAAMQAYTGGQAHQIAQRSALENALEQAAGSSFAGYLEDELSF
ncbi:MAG: hypothetical protein IKU34_09460 [Clostridia bacterium]|nr:hypothetical protein [Clostridia bacterium]